MAAESNGSIPATADEQQKLEKNRGDETSSDEEDPLNKKDPQRNISTTQKVRYIINAEADDEEVLELGSHPLFTQMDVLVHFDEGEVAWKEISRWLKYEETVEVGDRWSKPYVSTTSMHGLQLLRESFDSEHCAVALGMDIKSADNPVVDALLATLREHSDPPVDEETLRHIRVVLVAPHKHQDRKVKKKKPETDAQRLSRFRRQSGEGIDIGLSLYRYPKGADPSKLEPYKPNKRLVKKLPKQCEVANILIGQVEFLQKPLSAFCRLETPALNGDLTEVELPTRFVYLVLSPKDAAKNTIWETSEMGRSLASLLGDQVFCEVAYKAKSAVDLVNGIDEFIDDLTVLPPSVWDPSTRLEPPQRTVGMERVMSRLSESKRGPSGPVADEVEEGASSDQTLQRTGRLFGGLINDVKNRYSLYKSDILDGFHVQCLASTIFLFFACITPIVTFGGLMGQKTDGCMGTIETLLSGAICGVLFALFAGQPLTIVGATGPLLVFESILYYLCKSNGIAFMAFRFWIGVWVVVALMIIVAFDLSALVRYITRFTEECFAILISVIFIYEAFTKVAEIFTHSPVHTGVARENASAPWLYECYCLPLPGIPPAGPTSPYGRGNRSSMTFDNYTDPYANWTAEYTEDCITYNDRLEVRTDCISEKQCEQLGWNLTGMACGNPRLTASVPDVFFMSGILFIGTFSLAYALRTFRTSRYFPSIVRNTVADFAVFLSVMTWTCIDYSFGLTTPKLNVPAEFKPTRADRGWVVNPGGIMPQWWLAILAIVPALLGTILVFLDQQITAVIVNRKEHKLKKPHGYHLDLVVLSVTIFICSLLGLPWFVAATVRAITHVRSLLKESDVQIPGEKPQHIGCREQRVTGICIHILIGLSTLLTSLLRLIPMPVLYGVFMYMGVTSLAGVQFIERISILFMPIKYQPDYIFLRHCPTRRVHFFTIIQLVCFVLMWFIKSIKMTSIAFPVMLLALMGIRKVLDFIFTQSELYWLDHILPGEERIEIEDKQTMEILTAAAPPRRSISGSGNLTAAGRRSISGATRRPSVAMGQARRASEIQSFIGKDVEAFGTLYGRNA